MKHLKIVIPLLLMTTDLTAQIKVDTLETIYITTHRYVNNWKTSTSDSLVRKYILHVINEENPKIDSVLNEENKIDSVLAQMKKPPIIFADKFLEEVKANYFGLATLLSLATKSYISFDPLQFQTNKLYDYYRNRLLNSLGLYLKVAEYKSLVEVFSLGINRDTISAFF